MSPCVSTFKIKRRTNEKGESTLSDIKRGRFARPIRKNGNGLGIRYSIVERNRQNAAKSAIKLL